MIGHLMLIAARPKNQFGTTQLAGHLRREALARRIRQREVGEAAENLPALFGELEQTLDAEEVAK